MKFRILGPLEILSGAEPFQIGGTRNQIVAATLLLNANRVVSIDRLLEAIYGVDPPATSRSQAQISISSLRRRFAVHSRDTVISTHASGYCIHVGGGQLDAQQFEELTRAARAARHANDLDQAVARYRDALQFWRGPALSGIDSQLVRSAAGRLDEQRIAAVEDRIELELELGRHHEVIGELAELVEEFPLREHLRGQLILALHRSGRTAEALQAYQQARRTLIDELGIEPGERLRDLERAILAADAALDPPGRPAGRRPTSQPTPNLLPAGVADFTGRENEITRISRHLVPDAASAERRVAPVVVIVGRGGVGKTTLAVHAAHGLAPRFPDGVLFADLHGGGSRPVGPTQVLERFLRALGTAASAMPDGLDERAEMYRNLIADRSILVVLDDAVVESQVTPLLPGSGAAGVIVTSRNSLTGLAGVIHVGVNVFDAGDALELLRRITGDARVQAEPAAAAAVAAYCGRLPLALRIAGARLAARPHWSIGHLGDRLADETRRLDELRHGEMGIRPSISFVYESTGEQARCLFRLLALLNVHVFSAWLGAALLDQPLEEAENLLDDLVSAHLVEFVGTGSGVHSHYRFHELIRVFARERLASEEGTADRMAALERALGAVLSLAEEAHRRHYGGDFLRLRTSAPRWPLPKRVVCQLVDDPLAWLERERATLVAGVHRAAQAGFTELCWNLAFISVTLFESRICLDEWQETHDVALAAAQQAGDIRGQAAMLYSIGTLHLVQQRFGPARTEFERAARLFGDVGDDQGFALVTRHLASLDRLGARHEDAVRQYEQALAIFEKTGDRVAQAFVLHSLAQVKLELGDLDTARELLSAALRLVRGAGCKRIETQVLHRIGESHLLSGEPARSVQAFSAALAGIRELGDLIGEAYVLRGIGVAELRLGDLVAARASLDRSLKLARGAGERLAEALALLGRGELALADRDPGQAIPLVRQASLIFRTIGMPLYDARAQVMLGEAHAALGETEAAEAATRRPRVRRPRESAS